MFTFFSVSMATRGENTSFFILKCLHLDGLQNCISTGQWACQDRVNPPHPRHLLSDAHKEGQVILIFSVNNQRGWHGFCESLFASKDSVSSGYSIPVSCDSEFQQNAWHRIDHGKTEQTDEEKLFSNDARDDNELISNRVSNPWHYFPVKWIKHFQEFNKQTCLGFEKTEHLCFPDGSPVNKARNWHKVTAEVGKELCCLIEEYHKELTMERQRKEEEKMALREESYFKEEESTVTSESDIGWAGVTDKVERELGKVHLVCPFGSQRYNCNMPGSDNDIFILYQAKTVQMLGLDPPKFTIKNSDKEVVDYTVLELQRYCELLVAGDPKCTETLFLMDSKAVSKSSPEWRELCNLRQCLLTEPCLNKYMKEAQGTTGLKQLEKWRANNPGTEELTTKLNKLGYIILRLLQNARDLTTTQTLKVFREPGLQEREELLAVRQGSYTYSDLMAVIQRYLTEIDNHKVSVQPDSEQKKIKVQDWLLKCRIQDLQQHPYISID